MKPSSTQIQLFKHKIIYDSLRLTIPGFWNIPQPRKSRIPKQKKKNLTLVSQRAKLFFLNFKGISATVTEVHYSTHFPELKRQYSCTLTLAESRSPFQ